jgi:quercetin dioxygenase-like cupin family protein
MMVLRSGVLFVLLVCSACARPAPGPAVTPASPSGSWIAGGADPLAPAVLAANDPITTDGDKYRVILENARVRVLRYHDAPGARTNSHRHPDFVLYALGPFKRRLTVNGGATKERSFQTGDVIYMPAQTHIGENVGTTDTDVLIVEFKP